jgi:hypothetical protein
MPGIGLGTTSFSSNSSSNGRSNETSSYTPRSPEDQKKTDAWIAAQIKAERTSKQEAITNYNKTARVEDKKRDQLNGRKLESPNELLPGITYKATSVDPHDPDNEERQQLMFKFRFANQTEIDKFIQTGCKAYTSNFYHELYRVIWDRMNGTYDADLARTNISELFEIAKTHNIEFTQIPFICKPMVGYDPAIRYAKNAGDFANMITADMITKSYYILQFGRWPTAIRDAHIKDAFIQKLKDAMATDNQFDEYIFKAITPNRPSKSNKFLLRDAENGFQLVNKTSTDTAIPKDLATAFSKMKQTCWFAANQHCMQPGQIDSGFIADHRDYEYLVNIQMSTGIGDNPTLINAKNRVTRMFGFGGKRRKSRRSKRRIRKTRKH